MKIAIFSDFLHPELSGVSDSVKNLSCALADLGHTVMIVAPAYSKSDYKIIGSLKKEINLGPNIIIKRLPSFSVPFSPTGQNRFPLFLGKGIYLMWKFKPDIIHTNSPLVPGIEAFISSKLFKIPFIGTNHTPVSEFVKGPKWFVRLICRYWSWFYNMCDFVSTPSQFLIDYMRNHGFNSHKAIPISNPIDISKFSPAENISQKNELKKKFGFSKYTALFAGRLAEEKHVDDIIRAISLVKKEIPEISLVLTGHGKDEGRMKELSKELGILDAVHFLGFVDEKTYPLIFKASDIFTIMSTAESQGMSMILAMASGLPIIAAKARGLPEFIDNQNGLLVEIGDYKDLAKKIIELLKDQKLSKKMGENGIIFASKLSSDSIGKVWEKIYSDTLTGTNSYIKSKHKISLIIPAYNEEKYIGSCLDHAIKNSGGKFSEIIVVDNVSTDSTKSLAERRPGVRVIREERKGVTRARQRGYEETKGDILAFVDADTRMPEGWADRAIREFEKNPNLVCLSGPYIYHDVSKFKQFLVKLYWYFLAMPTYWLVGYMTVGGNFVIKREALDKMNGFDTNIEFYGEDTNTARRAHQFGKVKFMLSHFIYSSGRRLTKEGIFSSFKEYTLNFLSEVFLRRPVTKEYKDLR